MSTDLTIHQPQNALTEQMDYSRAVAAGSLLPQEYRNNPANVLIAIGLGRAMGLSPAESLYRISVIKGKPSAAAELIAANVRKAGHKLRVQVTENPPSATCTIIRADDPDEPTVVTRDMEWAQRMGLATNDNYKKQPSTMLSWRAITAAARLACSEALYGVAYTPDELSEGSTGQDATPRITAAAFTEAAEPAQDITDAEEIPETPAADEWPNDLTDSTRKRMFALFTKAGITDRDEQIKGITRVIGRPIESRAELTEDEARAVCIDIETFIAMKSGEQA